MNSPVMIPIEHLHVNLKVKPFRVRLTFTFASNASAARSVVRQVASYESDGEGVVHPALTDGTFLQACFGRGRLRPVLEAIPVPVVVSDTVALLGAARAAEEF